jgi:hypothetical protein
LVIVRVWMNFNEFSRNHPLQSLSAVTWFT